MTIAEDPKPKDGAHPCVPPVESSWNGSIGFYSHEPPRLDGESTTTPAATEREMEHGVESPPPAPGEVDVWLWEWQVMEDRRQVVLGETVDWDLVPMDQDWITKLFAGRRSVPLQFDTYVGHSEPDAAPEWARVSGVVQRIDQVSVRHVQTTDPSAKSPVAERGAAVVQTISSIRQDQPHSGSVTGWIVRLHESEGA